MPSPTVVDALIASLSSAAAYNKDDAEPPAAVLWTDEKREWDRLVPRLRMALPQFLTLGPYDPANRSGPAIWLRCVLAGKIPEVGLAPGIVPILYLPGVGRATLRATEDCPNELKPLAELQYRGVLWSQLNGKDWTVAAFLQTNQGGLDLRPARDAATAGSLRRCLDKLVDVPVADLRARSAAGELNSLYFDSLVSDDPIDDLLTWLSDPRGTRERWESGRWETLCSRCQADYGFDPARDGELVGAELLGVQDRAAWRTAWKRFAAVPNRYPGLFELLRKARPQPKPGDLLSGVRSESWPQDNDAHEADLRAALAALSSEPPDKARSRLIALEKEHGPRRGWAWARLNHAPLAHAIAHLATLAEVTSTPLTGARLADMVRAYTEGGWRADLATLESLAAVMTPQDTEAVAAAVAHVYKPWLRDTAELFQARAGSEPWPGKSSPRLGEVPAGTCVLFADGLRFDVGMKLIGLLEPKYGPVQATHHLVALPSVTPTAKPAVSPVAGKITGTAAGEEFRPCLASDGKDLTTERFRKLLEQAGFQVLAANETGDPRGRAWAEFGNIDATGHAEGIGLAHRIPGLLWHLVLRVGSLLEAGWPEVRIVTDHGWLLLPKGLPKSDLPKYLTESRWRRCAVVKGSATVELPCFDWFWSDGVRIASPPGIACFLAGEDYNHGGLSLQECVVPQITIRGGTPATVSAKIEAVKWAGLRCRIKVVGDFGGGSVDLREKAGDPATSIVGPKPVGQDGSVSLVVEKDAFEGRAMNLVLLDVGGLVVEKRPVTVGG